MMKIWGRPTSIHTQRVLWALADADLPYELTLASATMGPQAHVSKGGTPFGVVNTPAYLALNPNGTVPTIDDNGLILWESNAILMWLALRHAPDLLSGDAQQLARAVQWMTWTNGRVEPLLHTLVMELVRLPQAQRDPAKIEQTRIAMVQALRVLEAHLADQPYIAGNRFTLGDIPTGAAVYRWLVFDLQGPPMPKIASWQTRLAEHKGFRLHVAPREFHLAG